MGIYEIHAKILLFLHENYFKLVSSDFNRNESFDKKEFESGMQLNDYYKSRITYKEKFIGGGLKKVRPSFKVYESTKYGTFGIEYRSYSGLVGFKAKKKIEKKIEDGMSAERLKQGWGTGEFWNGRNGMFDFYLDTGNRYELLYNGGDATHFNLFDDLKRHATFEDCLKVWHGEDFYSGEKDKEKLEALITLFLLMFEQEVNYGELDFQQYTNFSISEGFRPRDMIMGFLNMMYNGKDDFDSYPFWTEKDGIKFSTHFGFDKEREGYANLENRYKKYFEEYRNIYPDVKSLFSNEDIKNSFIAAANAAGQNPELDKLVINN